ncbi:unnamed protein product [Pocillopora meandrina]|uniref:Heat shock factor binding protein 1 n=1 Tax=Pocillopora meandrina TaxID=46732 RepID=A0AAU9WX81_9CNID|nr:unnamed protein product [Pocillopora meandrina]
MAGVIFRSFLSCIATRDARFRPASSLRKTTRVDIMENPTSVPELMQFVQATLQSMQEKFQNVEDSIVKRMTETGKKLDEIEKGLTDLMDHSGMGEPYEEDLESDKDFSDTDKGR